MSRAAWLAFGSAAAIGCTSGATTGASPTDATAGAESSLPADSVAETGLASDAAEAQSTPVTTDAELSDASGDVTVDRTTVADGEADSDAGMPWYFTEGDGSFVCLSGYAFEPQSDAANSLGWVPLDAAVTCDRSTTFCSSAGPGSPLSDGCYAFGAPVSGAFGCVQAFTVFTPSGSCDAGLPRCSCLTFSDCCTTPSCRDDDAGGVIISCGHCYGAPPPRLERLRSSCDVA